MMSSPKTTSQRYQGRAEQRAEHFAPSAFSMGVWCLRCKSLMQTGQVDSWNHLLFRQKLQTCAAHRPFSHSAPVGALNSAPVRQLVSMQEPAVGMSDQHGSARHGLKFEVPLPPWIMSMVIHCKQLLSVATLNSHRYFTQPYQVKQKSKMCH